MHILDPILIIKTAGLIGIAIVIFAESGLFFGFFLPGDTLLFASGIFASRGFFPIEILILVCAVSAITGGFVGYWSGRKMGRKLFERESSFFFNKNRVYEAEKFYKKYGALTIFMARFIPLIRTFSPIIAGVAHMRYRTFILCNITSGILWATFVPLLGYYFGSLIPDVDRFLLPILILVVTFSFVPFIIKAIYHFVNKLP